MVWNKFLVFTMAAAVTLLIPNSPFSLAEVTATEEIAPSKGPKSRNGKDSEFASQSPSQKDSTKKIALIYIGPGSCDEDCSKAAYEMAELAHLKPRYVGPHDTDPELFKNAAVWIQPGGKSRIVSINMDPELKFNLKKFIFSGGGYVGFCAGGFYSTQKISDTEFEGLGILPGENRLLNEKAEFIVLPLLWLGKKAHVYWEGGPYFLPPPPHQQKGFNYQILAYYADGTAATVQAKYGLGNVVVTGVHPESPLWWKASEKLQDLDGDDFNLAVDMIQRAIEN